MTGPKPDPRKKASVDTVALKKQITKDSAAGANFTQGSAEQLVKGQKGEASNTLNRAIDANVSAGQGRATLDKARSGEIPATPKRPVNRTPEGAPIHHDDTGT